MHTTSPEGQASANQQLFCGELSEGALEAGALAVSDWRSLGGFELLGACDLVRRVCAAVRQAACTEFEAKP